MDKLLHGIVKTLSPVKKGKRASYFDGELPDKLPWPSRLFGLSKFPHIEDDLHVLEVTISLYC